MALKKPQIIVLPADENDSMALADVEQLAFDGPSPYALARNKKATTTCGSNDENKDDKEQPISHGRIMFGPPSEEKQKIRMEKLNERLKAVPRDYYIYKAILKTETEPAEGETETEEKKGEDKIVGFAAWRFCADQPFPAENDWQDSEWEGCASPQALNDLFGAFAKLRVEFFGGKNVALLETLAVHPSAQGLGVGTKMLQRGLEDAKKLGLKEAWLEASEAGYPLYQRFGWRDVHLLVTDFAKYGYEGSSTITVMKREEEEEA